MGTILASLHEEHKARQLRIRKAAFKAVTVPPPEEPQKHCSSIFDATVYEACRFYNVRPNDVFPNRHAPEVVKCRHIIAYIMYDLTSFTNPQIGVMLDRDPTSIRSAIDKIKHSLDTLQPEINEIKRRIALHKK